MHIFYAHGGGLGHLTRVSKLIKTLKLPADDVVIITPSVFRTYFKSYKFVEIAWNDSVLNWTEIIKQTIESYSKFGRLSCFYIDTFPFGLKGELMPIYNNFPELEYVYIARVLKWQTYLNATPYKLPIPFYKTLELETLYPEHIDWIKNNSKLTLQLELANTSVTPVAYMDSPYVLIAHSGGTDDVLKICNKAISDYKNRPDITFVLFTQIDVIIERENIIIHKNEYPINRYFHYAERIYTASGFNSMQELATYKNKHVSIPLDKLYDDQFFREANKIKIKA